MKEFLKKYYRYIVIFFVNVLMLGYIGLVILVLLGKVGSLDDWKIANYCTFTISSEVIDEYSSLNVDGDKVYFEYQHIESSHHYHEKIRFTSDSRGSIGGYSPHTYLYKAVDSIEISFTLEDDYIYKLQFTDIKVSELDDDTDPKSLSNNSYKVSNKNNVYTLKYNKESNIYIYSISILYLVKK